ncbi:MAG: GDP-mannose 4,6-dehydratase, partial [Terrimicrobiaceae bacterium]
EFYNLAAQSNANASWQLPGYTTDVNAIGPLTVLEILRNIQPDCRYFQAGSSDQFGSLSAVPADEKTQFFPENPYAVSKLFAHHITINYRKGYKMHASNGILFNHESPIRAENFIMSKIVHGAVRIKLKKQQQIALGSTDVVRDWGYAPDFVEAMWKIVQHDVPDDYVVCTGRPASFEELIKITFNYLGFDDWRPYVKIDPALQRPTEVLVRYGNPDYIQKQLGWKARTSLENTLALMIEHTLKNLTI